MFGFLELGVLCLCVLVFVVCVVFIFIFIFMIGVYLIKPRPFAFLFSKAHHHYHHYYYHRHYHHHHHHHYHYFIILFYLFSHFKFCFYLFIFFVLCPDQRFSAQTSSHVELKFRQSQHPHDSEDHQRSRVDLQRPWSCSFGCNNLNPLSNIAGAQSPAKRPTNADGITWPVWMAVSPEFECVRISVKLKG